MRTFAETVTLFVPNMSNREAAIKKMNDLGKQGVPFLFVLDFALQTPVVQALADVNPAEFLFEVNGFRNFSSPRPLRKAIHFEKYPLAFAEYLPKFEKVKQHIQAGNSFLVNLTYPTPIETNLTLHDIFLQSKARYKLWWRHHFVCFSPETFVQIRQGQIASFPMKGTIDASIPNAEQIILDDAKETAEHHTIVDLIRNDVSMVAQQVRVERLRYIEKVRTNHKHLLQVSSKIVGDLDPNYADKLGDLLFQLLPAGSISGAPKAKTLAIIQEAEQYERGFYTGVFGIFDGKHLDGGVLIRFIEQTSNGFVYKSGGGITAFSEAEKEYQELIDKVYLPIGSPKNASAVKNFPSAYKF